MNWIQGLEIIDLVIIVGYFLFVVLLGLRYSKSNTAESYFLAGRGMNWVVIGLSMFAASISSSTLIGHAGDAYNTGIAVFNYNLVSIVVMVGFAWFFLPFYIKARIYTIPEFLERRFSAASRYYFSAVTIIINIFLDAAGALYAAALVMKLLFPEAELITLCAIFALIVAAYTIPGGLSAAIRVDLMQGVILLVGAIILTSIAYAKGGGEYILENMRNNEILTKLVRPNNDTSVPWLGMVLGIPVLGFFFWGNNQQLVQRVLTAKSVDEGRKGVIFVGFLTLITLFIIIIPGTMAQSLFPNLAKPDMVYPTLIIELLPVGLVGFLIAALVAALTSSLSGLLNSVATLFTIDFYDKIWPETSSKKQVTVGRIVSMVVLVIAVLWAPQIGNKFGSLLKYYQEMLSIVAPPIVTAFFLGVFWKRANAKGIFIGLLLGVALGIFNLVYKVNTGVSIFGDIHFLLTVPFYVVWSVIVMVSASLLTEEPDYKKIAPYIWSKAEFDAETKALKKVAWKDNYRIWSYALLGACAVVLVVFW